MPYIALISHKDGYNNHNYKNEQIIAKIKNNMTRQEAIDRWMHIAYTVFRAEDNISEEWHERLKEAVKQSPEHQKAVADQYCKAIAKEIVRHTTDEELAKME